MDWKEELAKLTLGKIVTGFLLLGGFLMAVVWRETLYGKWVQVAEGQSKQGLLALLGLAIMAVLIEALGIACLLYLYRRKRKPTELEMLKRFGVLWDFDLNPHCPVDKTPMAFFSHGLISDHQCDYLICPACKATIPLWDSISGGLNVQKAQQLVGVDIPWEQTADYKRIKAHK